MQIKIKIGRPGEAKVDVLAVPLFAIDKKKKQLPSSLSALDKAAGGALSLVVKQGDFKGVAGEMQTIYPAIPGNAKRFLLLGMGAPDKLDAEGLRALTARAMKLGRAKHAKSVGIVAPAAKGISAPDACQFMSECAVLGLYRFDEYLTDNGKKKKPVPAAVRVPKGIELNEDQRAKVEALNKEFGPKLAACRKEAAGVISADQKKARSEAMKAAKAAGKKGKEMRAAAEAASKVTEDQKQQLARCKKDMGALQKEIRSQLAGILTDEQKAKLKGGKKK